MECFVFRRNVESSVGMFKTFNLNKKYQTSSRNIDYFLKKESQGLEATFSSPECVENEFLLQQVSTSKDNPKPKPLKPFGDLSTKQKKRRTLSLTHENTFEELALAIKLRSKMEGRKELSKIIEHLLENDHDITKVSDFLFKTSKNQFAFIRKNRLL